jgi:hypothetical protein
MSTADARLIGTAGPDIDSSAVTPSSSDSYLRQGIVKAVVHAGASGKGVIGAVNVHEAEDANVQTQTRQDRSKEAAEKKNVSAQTMLVVGAVVDPSKAASVIKGSWHVSASDGSCETASCSTRDEMKDGCAGTKGKLQLSVEEAKDSAVGAATNSDGPTGVEQSAAAQSAAEVFVAGVEPSTFPALSGLPLIIVNSGDQLETSNAMPKGSTSVDVAEDFPSVDGLSEAKSLAGVALGISTHGVANGVQIALNPQGDPSKSGGGLVTPRPTDGAATLAPLQPIAHPVATPWPSAPTAAGTTHATKAQILPTATSLASADVVGVSPINSAKLIQTLGESEMHVGMHSAEFGDISIRTSLSQQRMVTQISLDHNDLSQAISSHLSTMQAKLGEEYGLHASIEINNQGVPLSGGHRDSPQSDQQRCAPSSGAEVSVSGGGSESTSSVVAMTSADSGHGLDIRV